MSPDTFFTLILLGFAPFTAEHWAVLLIVLLGAGGGVWFFQDKKIKTLLQQQADQATVHASALKSQKEAAAAQATSAQKKLDEAATAYHLLDVRLIIAEVIQREWRLEILETGDGGIEPPISNNRQDWPEYLGFHESATRRRIDDRERRESAAFCRIGH